MNKLATILTSIILLFTAVVLPVGNAAAVNIAPKCGQGSANGTPHVCTAISSQGTNNNPIIGIIKTAITIVSYVVGALAIILILVSAIRMVTSGGNAQAAASARSGFTYALVGIAIAAMAQAIVAFVLNKLQ